MSTDEPLGKELPKQVQAASEATETAEGLTPGTSASTGQMPTQIGGYRILSILGEGGMGTVYEAEDTLAERRIAIKVMKPVRSSSEKNRKRFLREARAAAGLHHDHIIPVFQVGQENDFLFITMPLLQGETLQELLKREGAIPWQHAARIGREVAAGLAAAHEKNLIHRDIKPGNIWMEQQSGGPSRARLLDFGLARPIGDDDGPTATGAVLGTPGYMAPEQADGDDVDGRADLFSLGCVLYRMTTGNKPFPGKTTTAVLKSLVAHDPEPIFSTNPSVPQPLSDLIHSLLAKDPGQRPQTAQAVIQSLQEIEAEADLEETQPYYRPQKRHPSKAKATLMLFGCLLLVGGVIWGIQHFSPEQEQVPQVSAPAQVEITKLDVSVWKQGNRGQPVTLAVDGTLPLQPGDYVRYEVTLNRPGYVYLFYVDAEGAVSPMYPWLDYEWDQVPRIEAKRSHLAIPEDPVRDAAPLTDGSSGIEALLVLASDTPLLHAHDWSKVKTILGGKPPFWEFNKLLGPVWLAEKQDKYLVQSDRARPALNKSRQLEDPVQRIRRLVRHPDLLRLGAVHGVCYPFQGK